MKKPFLLFALKFSVIIYFAACTSIDHYTIGRTATPIVTKGVWKVNYFSAADNDRTKDLSGYTFIFRSSGTIKATRNGVETNGKWFEDEIANRVSIDLGTTDPSLKKINGQWNILDIGISNIGFQDNNKTFDEKLSIAML